MVNPISIATLGLCLTLSGCSVLDGEKIDYKSAGKVPSLEVPPDLTQLAKDPRYAAPAGVVGASGFRAVPTSQVAPQTPVSTLGDVRS